MKEFDSIREYVREEKIYVTIDVAIFTIQDNELKILLVQRNMDPFKNSWALPGGFFHNDLSLEEAAKKKLYDETGVDNVYLEQLYTFGDLDRDPRGRVITVSYFALINWHNVKIKAQVSDVANVKWFSVKNLPKLAFDHNEIIEYAVKRLGWKLEYTTAAYSLLPKTFTFTELQKVYEIILDKKMDKRNFRKKILSLGIIVDTKKVKRDVSHRPAKLYSFKKRSLERVDIL